jgi:hypothetical protein
MPKKVLPFPAPPRQVNAPIVCHHSRVNVRVGTQSYAIDITAQATMLPSEPARPVQHLRVETRYLRLSRPVALSDRIDGWRVCWLGGWDQGKVFFVVMVERVTRAGASRSLANFVGNDAFVPRWSLFYVFRPTFGAGLALLVFFGYRIGAVAGVKGAAPADPFAATFVAGMVGLFADTVMQKLSLVRGICG